MSHEINFTQKRVREIEPGEERIEYKDTKTVGLTLRVTPRGKKIFYFRRWVDGSMKRVKLPASAGDNAVTACSIRVGSGVARSSPPAPNAMRY